MAYYLTIKNRNGNKLLDVTSCETYRRLSKFKNTSYSLEEIDMFTSQFENEYEFKKELFNKGIITIEDITKEITIRRKNKDKLVKVMYDLIYKNNAKFLNTDYLRNILLTLQKDELFLNKLINHYRKNYRQENLAKIRAILCGYRDNDINIHEALNSFFFEEVYDIDYKTGITKLKYKSLHDLAMFVYNYLLNKEKNQSESEIEATEKNKLEKLKNSLLQQEEKVDLKVKVKKKKYQLDGQTSFF